MLAHARLPQSQRPPAFDLHLVWLLVGREVGAQLAKRRGVRLDGVGDVVLTNSGVALHAGRAEILPVGPDVATYFKKTTHAVRRCKNE